MKRTKEDAEVTRQNIMKAAIGEFARNGFSSTRLQDIAKAAGVTRGAIYWHFKDKIELFIEIYSVAIDSIFSMILDIVAGPATPLEKMKQILVMVGQKVTTDDFLRGVAMIQFNIEWTKEIQNRIETVIKSKTDKRIFNSLVEKGKELGQIKTNVSTDILADYLFVNLQGIAHTLLDPVENFDIENLQGVIDLTIDSIRHPDYDLNSVNNKHS